MTNKRKTQRGGAVAQIHCEPIRRGAQLQPISALQINIENESQE
jgi:hypothetical protein